MMLFGMMLFGSRYYHTVYMVYMVYTVYTVYALYTALDPRAGEITMPGDPKARDRPLLSD